MNKKRSNEYGFTLIELLIAIAIMLSITVLAIVNIVGVSNRKKEEAWQSVKEEIETAATDYFKYNEYLFEGLGDDDLSGYITVGSLVNDDYLNKVTDPRSGKAVSYCTKVMVTKNGRGVTSKINDSTISNENEGCNASAVVTVSNAKNAPKLEINKLCGKTGNNYWCVGESKPKALATATPVNGSEVVSVSKSEESKDYECGDLKGKSTKSQICTLEKETSKGGSKIEVIAKSADGGITKTWTTIKYDKTPPEVWLDIKSKDKKEEYNTKNAKIEAIIKESGSGVVKVNSTVNEVEKDIFGNKNDYSKNEFKLSNDYPLSTTYDGYTKKVMVEVTDQAGNVGKDTKSYTVYKDCDEKKIVSTTYSNSSCSTSETYKRTPTYTYKDSHTEASCGTGTGTAQTVNCPTCPDVKVTKGAVEGDNGWYKKGTDETTTLTITPSDNTSYWTWATNQSDGKMKKWKTNNGNGVETYNNIGIKGKTLGDGRRKYQIVVYDSNDNSKVCNGNLNIDTKEPDGKLEIINTGVYKGKKLNINSNSVYLKASNIKDDTSGIASVTPSQYYELRFNGTRGEKNIPVTFKKIKKSNNYKTDNFDIVDELPSDGASTTVGPYFGATSVISDVAGNKKTIKAEYETYHNCAWTNRDEKFEDKAYCKEVINEYSECKNGIRTHHVVEECYDRITGAACPGLEFTDLTDPCE